MAELKEIVAQLLPSNTGKLGKVMVKAIRHPNEMIANKDRMEFLSDPSKLTEEFDEADRIGLRVASAQTRKQLIEYCDFLQTLETSLFDIELAERKNCSRLNSLES